MKKVDRPTYSNTCRKRNWRSYLGIVGLECYDKKCPLIMTSIGQSYSAICAFREMDRKSIAKMLSERQGRA
jgi:hypothetical protein